MGQSNRRRHCNRVAGKQRKLHACLALCHPITHCGHTGRDLGSGAAFAKRNFDHFWIGCKRLVRRQHIIIGSDDPDIRGIFVDQSILIVTHSGIGMRLIAARQVGAGHTACRHLVNKLQIGGTRFLGACLYALCHRIYFWM